MQDQNKSTEQSLREKETRSHPDAWESSEAGRQQMEAALRESESLYRTLVETVPHAIQEVDTSGRIVYANAAHRQVFGYEPNELVGRSVFDLLASEEDLPRLRALLSDLVAHQPKPTPHQRKNRRKDGSLFDARIDWNYKRNQADEVVGFVRVVTDITEHKQLEESLERRVQQRTEELAAANERLRWLLELQERDRQLIAYEIHDGFTQDATGALMRLQASLQLLTSNPALAEEHLAAAMQLVRQSVDESRRLISGLRPPLLDEAGVIGAITYLINERRQTASSQIRFSHDVRFDRLPPPVESTVFRIVQEGLSNALRHSRSDRIEVRLLQKDNSLHIEVEDWGRGFDPSTVARDHFGLEGIRERAHSFGGRASVESVPGRGTCVQVELPLSNHRQE